jgi:fructose-bisphosphate aldolase, class II
MEKGEYENSEIVIQPLLRAAGAEQVSRDLVSVDARGIEAPADWDDLGSRETYLGYTCATNFASPGGASRDRPQEYALPDSLHLNRWAIAGDWTTRSQAAVLNAAGGRIAHRFQARDLPLVMAPGPAERPVRFRVVLDGEPPGSAHGVHTDASGNGSVAAPRLYHLARQRGRVIDQTFEITFLDPGVHAYVVTFGQRPLMPLATAHQYAEMLDRAAEGGYALAALRGFAEAEADGIVQYTPGAAEYMSGAGVRNAVLGVRGFAQFAHATAAASPVLVALHTDHCPPSRVDDWLRSLLAESERRVAAGQAPLFHSHMFDGSTLALDDNLRIAGGLLAECSKLDVVLEVECGVVGDKEDGLAGPAANQDKLYTTPTDLLKVADVLGTGGQGSYLVAATFGNVHGTYAPGNLMLRPEILRAGQDALAEAHPGARFRYVFHGSSGLGNRTSMKRSRSGW